MGFLCSVWTTNETKFDAKGGPLRQDLLAGQCFSGRDDFESAVRATIADNQLQVEISEVIRVALEKWDEITSSSNTCYLQVQMPTANPKIFLYISLKPDRDPRNSAPAALQIGISST